MSARSIAWAAPAALLLWYLSTHREGVVVGVPRLALWAVLFTAGGSGLLLGRTLASSPSTNVLRVALPAAATLIVGALSFGVVRYLVPATLLQASVAAALVAASLLAGALIGLRGRWGLSPGSLLAAQAIAMWVVVDVARIQTNVHIGDRIQIFLLYDFKVYLAAGRSFLAGETVYLDHVLTALPATTHDDFFLYPPVLLPVVAALASVPRELVEPAFFILLLVAGGVAFRLLGLSWPWALLFLAYPPVFKGAIAGNVANLTFALYAAAPFVGALLVLGLLFKVHAAIPAVWLVRTRRWRELAIGVGVLLLLMLVTLPIVGVQSWFDYVNGLFYREQTQQALPVLYGQSLAQYLPLPVFAALSLAAVTVAVVAGGRKSLAMLGLAMIVASPSLWPHGFVMALPAALALPAPVLWLTLGVALGGSALWLLPVVAVSTILLDWKRLRIGPDPVHPLGGSRGPWEHAERREFSGPGPRCAAHAR